MRCLALQVSLEEVLQPEEHDLVILPAAGLKVPCKLSSKPKLFHIPTDTGALIIRIGLFLVGCGCRLVDPSKDYYTKEP